MTVETVANAALRYYAARNLRNAAKEALREFSRENDGRECDGREVVRNEGGNIVERNDGPQCYVSWLNRPREEWCELCTARQPIWEKYRDAAKASSNAMSALRGACARQAKALVAPVIPLPEPEHKSKKD